MNDNERLEGGICFGFTTDSEKYVKPLNSFQIIEETEEKKESTRLVN
jgi:hypothetical protein